jgi:hypothetical protein
MCLIWLKCLTSVFIDFIKVLADVDATWLVYCNWGDQNGDLYLGDTCFVILIDMTNKIAYI